MNENAPPSRYSTPATGLASSNKWLKLLTQPGSLYDGSLRIYQLLPLAGLLLFLVDALHGKLQMLEPSPKYGWATLLSTGHLHLSPAPAFHVVTRSRDNATLAGILMVLHSPTMLLYTCTQAPPSNQPLSSACNASNLIALYLIHHLDRAFISPLRTPSRARSHFIIPIAAITFNLLSGGLIGSRLSPGVVDRDQ